MAESIYQVPGPRKIHHVPMSFVEDDALVFISRLPNSSGAAVGARLTAESRCSECGGALVGEPIEIDCTADFDAAVVTHRKCLT